MFEQLFQHLRALESTDGIRRIVTLDQQFRTHPVLGEFVSAQFYDRHGEAFRNGRPDPADFAPRLAGVRRTASGLDRRPGGNGARDRAEQDPRGRGEGDRP